MLHLCGLFINLLYFNFNLIKNYYRLLITIFQLSFVKEIWRFLSIETVWLSYFCVLKRKMNNIYISSYRIVWPEISHPNRMRASSEGRSRSDRFMIPICNKLKLFMPLFLKIMWVMKIVTKSAHIYLFIILFIHYLRMHRIQNCQNFKFSYF